MHRFAVEIDDRDIRGGEKKWHHVKRGVPIRLEIGPKDIEKNSRLFWGDAINPRASPGSDVRELVGNSIGQPILGRHAASHCSIRAETSRGQFN